MRVTPDENRCLPVYVGVGWEVDLVRGLCWGSGKRLGALFSSLGVDPGAKPLSAPALGAGSATVS